MNPKEFLVSAGVGEEVDADVEGAVTSSRACAVHLELDVDVTVEGEGNVAAAGDDAVVTTEADGIEDEHLVFAARRLEDRVEARVPLYDNGCYWRHRQKQHATTESEQSVQYDFVITHLEGLQNVVRRIRRGTLYQWRSVGCQRPCMDEQEICDFRPHPINFSRKKLRQAKNILASLFIHYLFKKIAAPPLCAAHGKPIETIGTLRHFVISNKI